MSELFDTLKKVFGAVAFSAYRSKKDKKRILDPMTFGMYDTMRIEGLSKSLPNEREARILAKVAALKRKFKKSKS